MARTNKQAATARSESTWSSKAVKGAGNNRVGTATNNIEKGEEVNNGSGSDRERRAAKMEASIRPLTRGG
jgi:hypothetical protein